MRYDHPSLHVYYVDISRLDARDYYVNDYKGRNHSTVYYFAHMTKPSYQYDSLSLCNKIVHNTASLKFHWYQICRHYIDLILRKDKGIYFLYFQISRYKLV